MSHTNLRSFLLISCIAFLLSSIPYGAAVQRQDVNHRFLGQITYQIDQNMYFSFIRQAAEGALLFTNRLGNQPNHPVFFNLEFLGIGLLQRYCGISENTLYQVWRFIGLFTLLYGFFALSQQIPLSNRRRLLARILFVFGGGCGILFLVAYGLRLIDETTAHYFMLDLTNGLNPFQQICTNPHFSLPHGVILLGFSSYLAAEQNHGNLKHYAIAGLFFLLDGFIRPYDLISVNAIFTLYALLEYLSSPKKVLPFLKRVLPCFITLPALIYATWLFKFDVIFKWWSLQGHNIHALALPPIHLMAYGLATVLAIMRIVQIKEQPLAQHERLLLVWFTTVFGLMHIGHIIPQLGFSPQLGTILTAPLVLLGLAAPIPQPLLQRLKKPVLMRISFLFFFLAIFAGSFSVIAYYTQRFLPSRNSDAYYASPYELAAWEWLRSKQTTGTVVLAAPPTSSRLCKYTSVSTLTGHYSVTPQYNEQEMVAQKLFKLLGLPESSCTLLDSLRIAYIYIGPEERSTYAIGNIPEECLNPVFKNNEVTIYQTTLR